MERSAWETTESFGYARRTSRFQYGFWAGSDAARFAKLADIKAHANSDVPLVAGVAYPSGLEPGGGNLLIPAIGIPEEIPGFTAVTSPRFRDVKMIKQRQYFALNHTEFFPESLWADVVERRFSSFPCRHWILKLYAAGGDGGGRMSTDSRRRKFTR